MRNWYADWRTLAGVRSTCEGTTVVSSGNGYAACAFSTPGFDGELLTVPSGAGGVGGDIHFITVNDARTVVTFLVVDISGHGAEVQELSESLEEMMRALVDEPDNSVLLAELNQLMLDSGIRGRYATAVAGSYDVSKGTWAYAYAGHPYMLHGSAGNWHELPAQAGRSLPIGIMHDALYLQTEQEVTAGEWLLLYSDGATDIRRTGGGRLGVDGLVQLAQSAAAASGETTTGVFARLVGNLVDLNRSDDFNDDFTLILLQCAPTPVPA